MTFKRRREQKRTKIEIIPMVDTMFFLLVFFMLSSLALTKMMGLPVDLPKASTAPRQDSNNLTLTIDKNQQVFVNRDSVGLTSLGSKLQQAVAGQNAKLDQVSLIINADTAVPHGFVVQCIDEARKIGVNKFAIATDPTSAPIVQ